MDPVGSFSVSLNPVWILSGRLGEIGMESFGSFGFVFLLCTVRVGLPS